MRKWIFLALVLVLSINEIRAQQATGYSAPGRLGEAEEGRDTRAPVIRLTNGSDQSPEVEQTRSIRVVPDATNNFEIQPDAAGRIVLTGLVKDDRAVLDLSVNGRKLRLQGGAREKSFGLRLNAGSIETLAFVATDVAGNTSKRVYDVKAATASNSNVLVALKSETERTADLLSPTLGNYWALVIGVSDYPHPSMKDLDFSIPDAEEIAEVLTQNYVFDPNQVKLLINPTRAQLISAFSAYTASGKNALTEKDNLLVYYAGHGYWDGSYEEGYWLPSDSESASRANWVSNSDIQKVFKAMKAKHILLLSDACFSGSIFKTRNAFSAAIQEAYRTPSRKAITAGNYSLVPDRSVFKEYLVKRLKQNIKAYLDAGTLYNSIKEAVTNNSPTRQRPIYGTIQDAGDEGGEFIFVKRN